MNIGSVFVIGLMSGTSLDGIDLVYVKFDKNRYQDFDILHSETVAYSEKWKSTLQNAITFSSDALKSLDIAYGKLLGEVLNGFIDKFNIDNIDFIASHGHTVLHQPQDGVTFQVGDGQTIANATNLKVICDFRTQDVQLGGQGAPLVPIGDELLFSDYEFCLNLGGFSNISFHKKGRRIAYDICPVNIVLNFYANKLGVDYDVSGKITLIDQLETNVSSILRTFVEHIAMQIGSVIAGSNSVLITGGGVFNSFLLERITFYAHIKITLTSSKIIDFKEALIFAFLGLLRSDGKVNCLKSVTGASKNHSSGEIFYPNRK